jgi:chromosome segregation ATPase
VLRDDTASSAQVQRLETRNTELRQDLEHARRQADEYRQSLMETESETARLRQQLLEAQHLASALGTGNVNERGLESDSSRMLLLATHEQPCVTGASQA